MSYSVSMQLVVNRSPLSDVVITTCAYPVSKTPEDAVKLMEALKNDVPALLVQMEHALKEREERVCPGCRGKGVH